MQNGNDNNKSKPKTLTKSNYYGKQNKMQY